MPHSVLTRAFLQPAATAAMHSHPEGFTHPPPSPVHPFLLAKNLSSKRIASTDNMPPKSDDAKKHYWWLKGKQGLPNFDQEAVVAQGWGLIHDECMRWNICHLQIFNPAQLHWATSHFDSLVKSALSYTAAHFMCSQCCLRQQCFFRIPTTVSQGLCVIFLAPTQLR